jgi:uncharacterized membrane protein YeaQ/YmgE (transglycosylase-associated protein family)
MYLLLWTIFGGFVGWLASILTHNDNRMGLILNVLVGIVGAFLGGMISNLFQLAPFDIFSFWGFVFSLIGASLFLLFINFMLRKRA